MQKLICILIMGMLSSNLIACDVCSCSGSTNNFGILPSFTRHFIGIKYQFKSFHSSPHKLNDIHYGPSDETFHSTELWGRMIIKKRLQVFGSIPYNINKRFEQHKTTQIHGIGDMNLMLSYVLIEPSNNQSTWQHSLQAGVGVKLPTGKSKQLQDNILLNQNIQLGSGSIDIPMNVMYTIRHKNFGYNTEFNYKFNTQNKMGYQFGNRFNATSRIFLQKKTTSFTFIPHTGINLEYAFQDKLNSIKEDYTGGHFLFANAGFDTYFKKNALTLFLQQPLAGRYGEGHITSRTRFALSFILLF